MNDGEEKNVIFVRTCTFFNALKDMLGMKGAEG